MGRRCYAWSAIDFQRAVVDDDYYAEIHRSLRGAARERFERAVDDAWRAEQAQKTAPALR